MTTERPPQTSTALVPAPTSETAAPDPPSPRGGPQTEQGKMIVRRNRLQHGLAARTEVLIPGEALPDWQDFCAGFHTHYAPLGPTETGLVDRIATLFWRLARLERVEAGVYSWGLDGARSAHEVAILYTKLNSHTTGITGATEPSTIGMAYTRLAVDPNTWTILSNYERTLEGSLYRALSTLERLQAARTTVCR